MVTITNLDKLPNDYYNRPLYILVISNGTLNYRIVSLFSIKTREDMNEFFAIMAIIFGVFIISFVLINIRQIFTGNEFRGTCATNNPMLKNEIGECTVCGKSPGEECKMPEPGEATS